jgi:endo-1,4-beta-xylanase
MKADWSRRHLMTLALGAAASGCTQAGLIAPPKSAHTDPNSLDALARKKGLRFGAAMGVRDLADPQFCQIVREECGVIVAENQLKWPNIQPGPATFTFAAGDALGDFARDNGILFRGHNLLWHHPNWIPKWVAEYDYGPRPRQAAEKLLGNHIATECKHFSQIRSWDVINETIDAQTGALRETVFTKYMGPEVIDFAFHTAREAAPRAQLVYNDYMSWEASSAAHRAGVLRFLAELRTRKVPIDALGVQSHIGTDNTDTSTGFGGPKETEWHRFMDEVVAMGYDILITEFDVHDKGLPADIPSRDKTVADYGRAYLDLMLSYRQVKQVLTWGVVDHHSWLQTRWLRPDGLPKRPLIYDDNYRPKPLRAAVAAAFRSAPYR